MLGLAINSFLAFKSAITKNPILRDTLFLALMGVIAVALPWCAHTRGVSLGKSEASEEYDAKLSAQNAKHTQEIAELRADAEKRISAQASQVKEREKTYAKEIEELRVEFAAKNAAENAADRADSRSARDGSLRVRIRTEAASGCSDVPNPGTSAAGTHAETYSVVEGETSANLIDLASECDEERRKRSALIDWANNALRLCNGKRK